MKKNKSIAIIGTSGVPARYGGFETLAHHLVLNLSSEYNIHVYASKKIYAKDERIKNWNGAKIHYLPFNANGMMSIIYDIFSMIHSVFYADTIIILGVSGGLFIPFIRLFSKTKIIVNIDGMEWRRDKWSNPVKRFLKFSERIAVRFSHADVTDNLSIKRYTSIHYKSASHMIAYGADHVSHQELHDQDFKKYPFLKNVYYFKVARIEPENNLELILSTFSKVPNKKLVVVGNWNNSEFGTSLREKYNDHKNLYLLDPIFDQIELNKLRSNCLVYIHGHSAGGTNPSLVEAMYLGLSVFSFDVSYNRATTHNKCSYFKTEEDLFNLLNSTSYAELQNIGTQMLRIAKLNYTWKSISNRYSAIVQSFEFEYRKQKIRSKYTHSTYRDLIKLEHAHLQETVPFYQTLNPQNHE